MEGVIVSATGLTVGDETDAELSDLAAVVTSMGRHWSVINVYSRHVTLTEIV